MNLPQRDLARRSGVALGSLKRFEREGLISFDSMLSLAMVLGCLEDFDSLAAESHSPQLPPSLDALLEAPRTRRRATGRRGRNHGL